MLGKPPLSDSALILGALFVACTTVSIGFLADPFSANRVATAWNQSMLAVVTTAAPAPTTQKATTAQPCLDKTQGEITRSECRPGCVYDIQMPTFGATGEVKATPQYSKPGGPPGIVKYHGSVSLFGLGDHTYTCAAGSKPPTIGDTLVANGNRDLVGGRYAFKFIDTSSNVPLSSVLNNSVPGSGITPASTYSNAGAFGELNPAAGSNWANPSNTLNTQYQTMGGQTTQVDTGFTEPTQAPTTPKGTPGEFFETPYSRIDQDAQQTISITEGGTTRTQYFLPDGKQYWVYETGEVVMEEPPIGSVMSNPAAPTPPPAPAGAGTPPAPAVAQAVPSVPNTPPNIAPASSGGESVSDTSRTSLVGASTGDWVPCENITIRQPFSFTWVGTTVCPDY